MIPEAMMLHMLDDLDAKMQVMQAEFARHQTAGNDGARMTEWVRAMERPLLDSARYLEENMAAGNRIESEKVDAIPTEE
jgi:3'-5' exoribonuclease